MVAAQSPSTLKKLNAFSRMDSIDDEELETFKPNSAYEKLHAKIFHKMLTFFRVKLVFAH